MPNFGYHFARWQGAAVRWFYQAALPWIVRRQIATDNALPFEVYSYSGETALPEQVASIRSLLKFAGRPKKFTVVSDGSHSARSLDLIRRIDRSVVVARNTDHVPSMNDSKLRAYLTTHPTGKQLALVMSLPADSGPALYLDSDVLFFPGASSLAALDLSRNQYLPDCQLSADERLLREKAERDKPVNTGVLVLASKLDWSLSCRRFQELGGAPNFFTNQTMTHLTMHLNGASPLDLAKFVLQLDDQFIYSDSYASREIVLRHYVNPVRHKFWTALIR